MLQAQGAKPCDTRPIHLYHIQHRHRLLQLFNVRLRPAQGKILIGAVGQIMDRHKQLAAEGVALGF